MSLWFPIEGGSFLFPLLPNGDDAHLRLILCKTEDSRFIHAPVCTLNGHPPAIAHCRLSIGDHPFIRHDSFVDFKWTQIHHFTEIMEMTSSGNAKGQESMSMEILEYVRQEAAKARSMPRKFRPFFP